MITVLRAGEQHQIRSMQSTQLSDASDSVYAKAERYCMTGAPDEFKNDNFHVGVCVDHYASNQGANPKYPATGISYMFGGAHKYETFTVESVQEMIRKYVVAVDKGLVPEYISPNHEYVIAWLAQQNPHIPEDFIRIVMYHLSQGVAAGYITPQLLQPKKYAAKDQRTAHPSVQDYESKKQTREEERVNKDPIQQFLEYLKIGGIVAVIGVGVYALANAAKLVTALKPSPAAA